MANHIDKYLHQEYDNEAGRLHAYKRTKIVATVGPACDTFDKLLDLVKAGVNVFRLNFSHGSHEDKAKIINLYNKLIKHNPTILLFSLICKDQNCGLVNWRGVPLSW